MLLLGAHQEVTKKCAKTFPLGSPLALPLYKEKKEKDIKLLNASLAVLPPRAADMGSKRFCGVPRGIKPCLKIRVLCEEFC
jgi:hypothetical protein